ncbi:hydrolase [Kiloniella laminariae]|uniref:Hydrolase n=1 Tax=Kiloniella laminariae TaxID=454162 RepID=A0ABT4LLI0_9PROT|nr:hydrolase [Kiloniella laminariae]MCZ4281959.1 hydrolase [Kiloniella laminariae]
MLIDAQKALVVVIDVQEKLAPAIHELESLLKASELVLKSACELNVPVLVTEQYPRGLGHTIERLKTYYAPGDVFEKLSFSSVGCSPFMAQLKQSGRQQVIIIGIEAHVCVQQTVLELLDERFDVFVVADAIGSRTPENKQLALERMIRSGADVVSAEMVLFELLREAGTPAFKTLSQLLKAD